MPTYMYTYMSTYALTDILARAHVYIHGDWATDAQPDAHLTHMCAGRVDDPLDAVAVHMGSGLWGLIAAPLFYYEEGEWSVV